MRTRWLLSALLLACAIAPAQARDWVQQDGSRLAFAGKYQSEVFTGLFPGFRTQLFFDPANPQTARLQVEIPLAQATSGNGENDGELRGAAFFNVAAFANARFEGNGARQLADGRYAMDGHLTLRGIRKPVTLTFSWTDGANPVLFGRATVKRLDYGVGSGAFADVRMIANDIAISTRVVFAPVP